MQLGDIKRRSGLATRVQQLMKVVPSGVVRRKAKVCLIACALVACPLFLYSFIRLYIIQQGSGSLLRAKVGLNAQWRLRSQLKRSNTSNNVALENLLVRRPPDFVVIGARKCGTRALLSMISLHPQVVSAGPEVHYFDRDENYRRGLDWYVSQMTPSGVGQLTGEKSPSYFIIPSVPLRIKLYFESMKKKVKLLLVVREPVSRVISDFTQKLAQKGISTLDTERVRAEFVKKAFTSDGQVNVNWTTIKISLYSIFLDHWFKIFEPSDIHIVNGDNLINTPSSEMAKVSYFLGLDQSFNWKDHFYYNATRGFYCIRKGHSSNMSDCLGSTKGRKHPQLEPSLLQRLHQFFHPYNNKFVEMTGLKVDWFL